MSPIRKAKTAQKIGCFVYNRQLRHGIGKTSEELNNSSGLSPCSVSIAARHVCAMNARCSGQRAFLPMNRDAYEQFFYRA